MKPTISQLVQAILKSAMDTNPEAAPHAIIYAAVVVTMPLPKEAAVEAFLEARASYEELKDEENKNK